MSMLSARERMLGGLRAAAPHDKGDIAELDRKINHHFDSRRAQPAGGTEQLAESMRAAMSAVQADVWCAGADEWPAQLAGKLAAKGVKRLLLDPATREGAALGRVLPATVEPVLFDQPIEAWKQELFDTVDAGFTVARSGIASTGTLVLAPDRGSPRTASLVPPLHIALVYADTLHPDLHALAQSERWRDGMPSNLVLVSGPSKTSDIQQTLAYGAHGPRWVWVIIVIGSPTKGVQA